MIHTISDGFPKNWVYGKYENDIMNMLAENIQDGFPDCNNLLINGTWFGPQFDNSKYKKFQSIINATKIDNIFLVATVDPVMQTKAELDQIIKSTNANLYLIGNFDKSPYEFNFFSYAVTENFVEYNNNDIILEELKFIYINYNRKPREHRVNFVKELIKHNLIEDGIVTLGKPDIMYDKDPDNNLFLTIGEDPNNYLDHGDWFGANDTTGIPHDLFSLHNMSIWKHSFLYINAATEFNPWDDVFVMQDQYRPIIGLRPFLINGNTRTYKWLRDRGFKTFTEYFPSINLEDECNVHSNLIQILQWLKQQSNEEILSMYNDMMPALLYNQARMYEFSNEQKTKIQTMFKRK